MDEEPPSKRFCGEAESIGTNNEADVGTHRADGDVGAHRADGGCSIADGEQQYQLLDEVTEDNDEAGAYSSESSLEGDDIDEVDALLEESMPKKDSSQEITEKPVYVEVERTLLEDLEKMSNPFYALPDGWLQIIHKSGMPLYLHRSTRVCCISRPYFIGHTNFRKHDIPVCAVPCLQYKKLLEKSQGSTESSNDAKDVEVLTGNEISATVNSVAEVIETNQSVNSGSENVGKTSTINNSPASAPSLPSTETSSTHENISNPPGSADMQSVISENDSVKGLPASSPKLLAVAETSPDAEKESTADNSLLKTESSANDTEVTNKNDVDSQSNASSARCPLFNTTLAKALNIHQEEKGSPASLLPSADAKICFEEQEPHSLSVDEFKDYCSKLFKFKTVKRYRFNSWNSRRRYTPRMKRMKQPMPEGMQLLSLKTEDKDELFAYKKRKWLLNPKGKGPLCILHEYVQFVFKSQPEYVYKEVENSSCPYAAAIHINNIEYATGYGSSKRLAKAEAAKATLAIIMPELAKQLNTDSDSNSKSDLEFFDTVHIEDPCVPELCSKMSELPPYSLLLNCLKKNSCLENSGISIKLINRNNQKNEYIMTAGKHTVSVMCKNKKEGKQKAAQAMLHKLHPHIDKWGSMLRLYGNDTIKQLKDKKKGEQEVTLLQNKATVNQPNFSIINMLKKEMLKLHEKRQSVVPLGDFKPPDDMILPPPSTSDLNTLDL